ncbi:ATP-binding protein [Ruegeria sp. HKCCD6119]|uniref:ATP-binding protein n=1 Tax=Ruegeria sp. HKCCD6119 TaxID=2683003 RepID=UPI0014921C51|nr:ATP-binding protein [Ruegeria sp. HKCCD6119]NOD83365.1 response regulator [Ruegeria sp. HKCCD6119]
MSDTVEFFSDPSLVHTPLASRLWSLVAVALLISIAPMVGLLPPDWTMGMMVAGTSLLIVALCVVIKGQVDVRHAQQTTAVMAAFAEQDESPFLIANAYGDILASNAPAREQFGAAKGASLENCLGSTFSTPQVILLRLQSQARSFGRAREDCVIRGNTSSVTVFQLAPDIFCWRFQQSEQESWQSLNLPVLTIGCADDVVCPNPAAKKLLGLRPGRVRDVFSDADPRVGASNIIKSQDGMIPVAVTELSRSSKERSLGLVPLIETPAPGASTSFADLPVPVLTLSPAGAILNANRLANKLLGNESLEGTNIADIMRGMGHPILDWLARTAAQEDAQRSEFLQLTRKDKEVFVQVTLSRVVVDGKICLIAVLNDATELKTLEAQFVQGQKMQAVGQLAGGVAHDFNNLLTAISGHCDLLLLRHDQNDPDYGDLVQINQNANRAAALVSQLLAFSRKQTLRPEVLDLRDTISDLIHLLNRLVGEKVLLTLSHDPVLKPVRADKRQLEQVLMNLVVNARDAMPDGGEIRIETEVLNLSQPLSRDRATVQPGEYVTVRVMDSGVGIPADKLQKVFEPFYTTKRTGEGTGLGLSTAYGIVKQTGGFIFVDSTVGRGTEFTVFLPVCATVAEAEQDIPAQPETQSARQGEGVVLLVEDEAPVRAFATRALRLKGYTVLEADSAEEALRLLEDPSLNVDVFVTDVVMPGMDGPTWVRKARESRPDARVVFVSGYTEGAFGDSEPEIANSTFLPKPFSLTQLTEAVFQQLN